MLDRHARAVVLEPRRQRAVGVGHGDDRQPRGARRLHQIERRHRPRGRRDLRVGQRVLLDVVEHVERPAHPARARRRHVDVALLPALRALDGDARPLVEGGGRDRDEEPRRLDALPEREHEPRVVDQIGQPLAKAQGGADQVEVLGPLERGAGLSGIVPELARRHEPAQVAVALLGAGEGDQPPGRGARVAELRAQDRPHAAALARGDQVHRAAEGVDVGQGESGEPQLPGPREHPRGGVDAGQEGVVPVVAKGDVQGPRTLTES